MSSMTSPVIPCITGEIESQEVLSSGQTKEIISDYIMTGNEEQLANDFKRYAETPVYLLFYDVLKDRRFAVPGARRGNKRYAWRMKTAFYELKEDLKHLNKLCGKKRTHVLFVNLTYERKGKTLDDLWKQVGKDWNNFMSRMRRRFGKIDAIRIFEPHKSGHPHIHAVLIFRDRDFSITPRLEKDKKTQEMIVRYRVTRYPTFIKKEWIRGYCDISGVTLFERAMRYILGTYFGKTWVVNDENKLGLSKMWYFKKRAYSISNNLRLDISYTTKNEKTAFNWIEFMGICVCYEYQLDKYEIISAVMDYDAKFNEVRWQITLNGYRRKSIKVNEALLTYVN